MPRLSVPSRCVSGRPKKTKYSSESKAAAMAALLAGQSCSQVAAEYKIPEGTVKAWSVRMRARPEVAAVASENNRVATEKKATEIGDLLVQYLRANLETLAAQQVVFRDPVWLRDQTADALAVLHGVLTDKAVRLLEALGGASTDAHA